MDEKETFEALPCGCRMGNVENVFVFEPHSLDCIYYLYVMQFAEERGKPITYLDL